MSKRDGGRPSLALPLIVRPERPLDLASWIASNREWLREELDLCGAVLFRDYGIGTVEKFAAVVQALSMELLEYSYRSTPRTGVASGIYTATEYPAHQRIPLHNENSYQSHWPWILIFCCLSPASRGGETPLARTAGVTARLHTERVGKLIERQILYVRNFTSDLDLPWQTAFQTQDRARVESYCAAHGIACTWKGDRLRTEQIRPAIVVHPHNHKVLWFNQAHLFHVSALDPGTRSALLSLRKESELPRNAYYGDGRPIEDHVLEHVRQAYELEAVNLCWHPGDVLILDNMLVCHGRNAYQGDRRLLLAMAGPTVIRPSEPLH